MTVNRGDHFWQKERSMQNPGIRKELAGSGAAGEDSGGWGGRGVGAQAAGSAPGKRSRRLGTGLQLLWVATTTRQPLLGATC